MDEMANELKGIRDRLDGIEGNLGDFSHLLTNHITDYTTKFSQLEVSIEGSIENSKERDKALHIKIDSYKWGLVLIASFTVIALGGFVVLAIYLVNNLIGG